MGKAFIGQLAGYMARNPAAGLTPILISRSATALVSHTYAALSLDGWADALAAAGTPPPAFPGQTLALLKAAPGPAILVDNTSDEAVAAAYPLFLAQGVHVVTPNKKGFSGSLQLWTDIYAAAANGSGGGSGGGYVFHEASVGAGLPVLSTLKELVETGDRVRRIEGIFSGTMSFLFNSFAPLDGDNGGKGFAACVRQAQQLGYTVCLPQPTCGMID